MASPEEMFLQTIEKNIKNWLSKNPKLLSDIRYDNRDEYKELASRKIMFFLKEAPRFRIYLREIGILDDGLTNAGYIFLRRIAQSI